MSRARLLRTLTTLGLAACGIAIAFVTTGAAKPSDVVGSAPVIASGTLQAPDGSPLANAAVVLYLTPPPSASTGPLPIVATTTAGADGSYVLTAANDQLIQGSDA